MTRTLWIAIGSLAAVAGTLPACATPLPKASADVEARYAAAAQLTRTHLAADVKNGLVIPRWIKGRDAFWYRRETPEGAEFVVFDAATGEKRPAFPQAEMAAALTRLMKTDLTAQTLPFNAFDFGADGRSVTFTVKDQVTTCQLAPVTCSAAPASPVTTSMSVAPDGVSAVLVREGNLWLRDMKTGAEHALTTDGRPDNGYGIPPDWGDTHRLATLRDGKPVAPFGVRWSPDSRRVIVTRVDQSHVQPYPYVEYAPLDGSFRPKAYILRIPLAGEALPVVTWYVLDLSAGTRQAVDLPYSDLEMKTPGGESSSGFWSADGAHHFVFLPGRDEHSAYLFDIDLATGRSREVIKETVSPPAILNAGGGFAAPAVAILGGGAEAIWFSQRSGWGQLYLYDVTTGRLKNAITHGDFTVRDIVKVDETARQLYFVASGLQTEDPYWRDLYRVNLDGTGLMRLSPEPGDKMLINPKTPFSFDAAKGYESVSPDNKYVAYTVSKIAEAPELIVRRVADGRRIAMVERADISRLLAAGYRPPEAFVAKAADGKTDIYGAIYRPPGYDRAKTYSVIDSNYNSPITPIAPHNFMAALSQTDISTQASWAALGFIVVTLDARGTPFRGRAFSDVPLGYTATMGLEDHVAVIRQLAARDPGLDLDRVGIAGASFGAWTSLRALIEYPDFFKAAVAGAPPGGWYNMQAAVVLADAYDGAPDYVGGGHLRPAPSDKPSNWSASDSVVQIAKIKGKLLILMGGLDENVIPGSTMQLEQAALVADRNFEFVFNPSGAHAGFYGAYATRKTWDFFVRNLEGETPPDDFRIEDGP
jgi:dipeptidyl-peptidase-4